MSPRVVPTPSCSRNGRIGWGRLAPSPRRVQAARHEVRVRRANRGQHALQQPGTVCSTRRAECVLIEQHSSVHSQQPRHRSTPVGHDDLLVLASCPSREIDTVVAWRPRDRQSNAESRRGTTASSSSCPTKHQFVDLVNHLHRCDGGSPWESARHPRSVRTPPASASGLVNEYGGVYITTLASSLRLLRAGVARLIRCGLIVIVFRLPVAVAGLPGRRRGLPRRRLRRPARGLRLTHRRRRLPGR